MFPPGGAGFAGVPKIAPGGVYAADASSQTIGTTGANAAAQTAPEVRSQWKEIYGFRSKA